MTELENLDEEALKSFERTFEKALCDLRDPSSETYKRMQIKRRELDIAFAPLHKAIWDSERLTERDYGITITL